VLEPIEPTLDQIAIVMDPPVEVPEGLRPQGVEMPLTLGADPNEAAVVKNAKVAGNPWLADGKSRDERAHRSLAPSQLLDDTQSCRIRQDIEREPRSCHDLTI